MSNVFDINRFGKYFVFDLKNAKANYGINLLVFSLMPLAWYLIGVLWNLIFGGDSIPGLGTRIGLFWVPALILCISFPAVLYGRLTDRAQGSQWLLVPASRLEKFLSMIIISAVVVPVLFMAMYSLTDWVLSLVDPRYGSALASFNVNEHLVDDSGAYFKFTGRGFWLIWLSLAQVALTFLLGAVLWKKGKVGLTILALMGLGTLSSIISFVFAASYGSVNIDNEVLEQWFFKVAGNAELYLNLAIWLSYGFWIAVLSVGIWFVLKNLKH